MTVEDLNHFLAHLPLPVGFSLMRAWPANLAATYVSRLFPVLRHYACGEPTPIPGMFFVRVGARFSGKQVPVMLVEREEFTGIDAMLPEHAKAKVNQAIERLKERAFRAGLQLIESEVP